jgi:NAD(P)-dependent dehydrogenase (short-subunit alcohol dehydrogenase family)
MIKSAIVTGGASGIGAALSAELVRGGASVILVDIDGESAGQTAEKLSAIGPGRASGVRVDVRNADAVRSAVDQAVQANGCPDLMVNNAVIGIGGKTEDLDLVHWNRAIDVNLRGVIHGVHAVLPHMLAAGHGQIVNTASLAGLIPTALMAPYTATKHAVVGLTLSMRLEFASRGIGFCVVCPGFTDTPLLDNRGPDDLPEVASLPNVRRIAETLPEGVYPVQSLAKDIMRGIEHNEAIIVTPESSREAWWVWRESPDKFMAAYSRASVGPLAGTSTREE